MVSTFGEGVARRLNPGTTPPYGVRNWRKVLRRSRFSGSSAEGRHNKDLCVGIGVGKLVEGARHPADAYLAGDERRNVEVAVRD